MTNRNINVTITGSSNKGKELISNVITTALTEQGFTNVALITPAGEPMVGSNVPSLMDLMKAHDPQFLATPVHVIGIPETAGEEETSTVMNNGMIVSSGRSDDVDGGSISMTTIIETATEEA